MKFLVVGASGQIGRFLMKAVRPPDQVFGTFLSLPADALARGGGTQSGGRGQGLAAPAPENWLRLNIVDAARVRAVFERVRPSHVALCAALTHVDFCQEHPEQAAKVNVEGVRNVLEACAAHASKLAFFSTEYVFDGINGPYEENDAPRPLSVYGQTKLDAERLLLDCALAPLIIRTTVVYSFLPGSKNFIMQLADRLRQGQFMNVANDKYSHPTYAPNLAAVTRSLIGAGKTGIYHVVGPDYMNRYDFALKAAEILGFDKSFIRPISTTELGQKAPRPLRAGLKTDKLARDLGHALTGVEAALREIRPQLSANAA